MSIYSLREFVYLYRKSQRRTEEKMALHKTSVWDNHEFLLQHSRLAEQIAYV